MKRASILLLLVLACAGVNAQSNASKSSGFTKLDKIVAIVNREVITQSQLNTEIDHVRKTMEQSNQPLPPPGELRSKILDGLIAKKLTLQLCESRNITASDDDVNKAIDKILKMNNIGLDQLKGALAQQGLTFDNYKKNLKDQIAMQKLQQDEVARTVTVTPEDVKKFVRENKDKLNGYSAFHVIDVVMPITEAASTTQVDSLRKQANEVVTSLQKGKSIEEILKQYPYAQNNDLGWRSLGELPSIFQAKVAGMSVKSVSSPVQAPNGFHILQLVDAKGDNHKLSDADLKNLVFQQKMTDGVKEFTDKLRQESYVKIMN